MNCKTFEKQIQPYLRDELDMADVTEFLRHLDSCEACQEELSIQILIEQGMPNLEAGENFHLGNAVKHQVNGSRRVVDRYDRLFMLTSWLEIMAFAGTALCVWCALHFFGGIL